MLLVFPFLKVERIPWSFFKGFQVYRMFEELTEGIITLIFLGALAPSMFYWYRTTEISYLELDGVDAFLLGFKPWS